MCLANLVYDLLDFDCMRIKVAYLCEYFLFLFECSGVLPVLRAEGNELCNLWSEMC